MRSVAARWLGFWFAPAPPTTLAVCRILFFGAIFAQYFRLDVRGIDDLPEALWTPTWLFAAFDLPLAAAPVLRWLQHAWKAALLLSCVGLATRVSSAVSFVLGFYLFGLPHNFGKIDHADAIVVLALGVMALSRAGDALSLDATIARLRGRPRAVPAPSGEYTWPIRCVWLALALVYLAAGIGKLTASGLAWIASDQLALLLLRSQYEYQPATAWGPWLARWPWVCHALAAATILIELAYPLALTNRRVRLLVVPSAVAMQLAIGLLIGPRFYSLLTCNLFWVPWAALMSRPIPARHRACTARTRAR